MTTREAYQVLDDWRAFTPETVAYAREIVESFERQGGTREDLR